MECCYWNSNLLFDVNELPELHTIWRLTFCLQLPPLITYEFYSRNEINVLTMTIKFSLDIRLKKIAIEFLKPTKYTSFLGVLWKSSWYFEPGGGVWKRSRALCIYINSYLTNPPPLPSPPYYCHLTPRSWCF